MVDKTYIGMLERTEVNPTVGTLLKIADALGVDLVKKVTPAIGTMTPFRAMECVAGS